MYLTWPTCWNRRHSPRATLLAVLALIACDGGGDGTGPGGPADILKVAGDGQAALVGTELPDPLRVQVTDASGSGLDGIEVTFRVESGTATLAPVTEITAGGGFASTRVTLGPEGEEILIGAEAAGLADPVRFTVTALAPSSIEVGAGDGVSVPIGAEVALEARVLDQRSDPLGGVTVDWALTDSAGPGARLAMARSTTDASGVAANRLTLGDSTGSYTVRASVVGVAGGITFSLTATSAPRITSVSPSPVREGAAATLAGQNFDPSPAVNVVTVDGVRATVVSASATQLEIVVPASACLPARDSAAFRVEIGGIGGPTFFGRAIPGDTSVAVLGESEHRVRSDSATVECVQVPARASGSSLLIVPVIAAAMSGVNVPERLTRRTGSDSVFGIGGFNYGRPSGSADPGQYGNVGRLPARPPTVGRAVERAKRAAMERRIRHYEAELYSRAAASARARFGAEAMTRAAGASALAEGDTIFLNVVDASADDLCNTFSTITAVVRSMGARGIAVEDTASPESGFSDADYDDLVAEFDAKTFPADTSYFGSPSDLDENGATFLVFTPEINKLGDPDAGSFTGGFFFAGDLFPSSGQNSCAASNEGELVYLLVPDPDGEFGRQHETSFVRQLSRGTIAHELQHLINTSQRLFVTQAPSPEVIWLNEGLSHIAEEIVGHAVTGLASGSNISFLEANLDPDAFDAFYFQNFARLGTYLEAPDSVSGNAPIDSDADLPTRGAIWSFLRWILDQERDPGTETSLTRSLVITTEVGIENLESSLGKSFQELLPEWVLALYADDFVDGVDPRLLITTWDMRDIYQMDARFGGYPLSPIALGHADGTDEYSVVSGSARYFLLSSATATPAISLRFTDGSGGALDLAGFEPRTLVLRIP